ncbi:MAG: hypothetical protein HY321_08180 [Armatimonadetes bacterium]|nr:hypothetical protein [Armatimonadota bacterium]
MLGGFMHLLVMGALVVMMIMVAMLVLKVLVGAAIAILFALAPFVLAYWLLTRFVPALRQPSGWGAPSRAGRFSWPFSRPAGEPENAGAWVREAREAAADIRRLVRRGDRAGRAALAGVPASAARLADRVRELAHLYRSLGENLRDADPAELSRRAAAMKVRAESAADPIIRDQYRAAAQSFSEQVGMALELRATRDRLHAEISRILAALTNMRSRIIAARSGAAAPGISDIDHAAEELAGLQTQVDTFQESVRQVLRSSHLAR